MKLFLALMAIALTGCITNAADNAIPAPTNLEGIYKGSIFGGSVTWQIFSNGTGIACEERTSMSTPVKIRDLVVNGSKAYDVFEFTIVDITALGFKAKGVADMNFKKINKLPAACK